MANPVNAGSRTDDGDAAVNFAAMLLGGPIGAHLPPCPNCGKNDRVERCSPELALVRGGEFFCPCNEPGPAFFNVLPAKMTVGICGLCSTPIRWQSEKPEGGWIHSTSNYPGDPHEPVLAAKPVYDPESASAEMATPGMELPSLALGHGISRKYVRASGETIEDVKQPFVAGHDAGIPPISVDESRELQDILRTLTNSGTALITSARQLVEAYEGVQRQLTESLRERDAIRTENVRLRRVWDAHRYWAFREIMDKLREWARGNTDELPQELRSMAFAHMHALANWLEMQVAKPLSMTVCDMSPLPPSDDGGVVMSDSPDEIVSAKTDIASDYDRSIHTNPDAMAWANFFINTVAGLSRGPKPLEAAAKLAMDQSYMHGWFANAMMAMHDHLEGKRQREAGEAGPDLEAEAAHRGKYPHRTLFLCGRLIIARCNQAAGAPVVDRGTTRDNCGVVFDSLVIRNPFAFSVDGGDEYPGGKAIAIGWRRK